MLWTCKGVIYCKLNMIKWLQKWEEEHTYKKITVHFGGAAILNHMQNPLNLVNFRRHKSNHFLQMLGQKCFAKKTPRLWSSADSNVVRPNGNNKCKNALIVSDQWNKLHEWQNTHSLKAQNLSIWDELTTNTDSYKWGAYT